MIRAHLLEFFILIVLSNRKSIKSLTLHLGAHDQGAGGSPNGPSVMSHLDYAKDVHQKGRFEEIFMHEASHACIDYLNGGKSKRYDVRKWFI